MRKKLPEEQKKTKVSFTINEKVNELIEDEMKKKGKKKSQIIEKVLSERLKK
jgi:hypothetical protein